MKKWHISFRVNKNDASSEIKTVKVNAPTGKEALDLFNAWAKFMQYDPFTTVFRCEGEVVEA
ncbi:hypothetical protein CON48_12305 [Bacillus thuringiensis]|uniref:Uncharacterized protein n=1 Tax=Bacillus thuringiensis TaxID=1428 RepID=A0A9X6Z703_BACTU|nr:MULTISPECIES: hypothetical protein [Bacillus]KIP28728.1 hypothetical protein BG10_6715 [Bacillus thuringiensis serovar morrisoni]MCT6948283.1 hypothetical protein [Bacillus thuringiensis]MDA2019426.1 hypothetical protein [Bacillus cereus]MEC2946000.1 hypothetical protein [Bacillus cereus]MEC3175726.1 hypothetical protein [Bacillus cereus]